MRLIRRGIFKHTYLICLFVLYIYYLTRIEKKEEGVEQKRQRLERRDEQPFPSLSKSDAFPDSGVVPGVPQRKVDWHDPDQEAKDLERRGPGEGGDPYQAPKGTEEQVQQGYEDNAFNSFVSDSIALDRSIKDLRHAKCRTTNYAEHLPTVSVVIPFFEEHRTTLLRTIVSVINRSPEKLLKQIILVDDGSSTKPFLKEPLDQWLKDHAPMAQVVRLPARVGLISARLEGAKRATGDVIVVLDSHCEVMVNWLPPLLDPIVNDYRTSVCPLIDAINKDTFAYGIQDNGGRGAFDWRLFYKRLPLSSADNDKLPEPFENPVMNGGLFAISRKWFWELGGYDEGIRIWGGEQYNLSFKIWQCGGRLLDAPCSRVGHIFKGAPKSRPTVDFDFLSVNYKRVAEVWMDDYKEALYIKNGHLREVDAGDLSKELEVKERLQCKSFKWFLDTVAPDLSKRYPPFEPPDFANGTVRSVAAPTLCLDKGSSEFGEIIMYGCHGLATQYFELCYLKTIRVESEQFCWQIPNTEGKAPFQGHCNSGVHIPSQTWRYDTQTQQIQSELHNWCLEAIPSDYKIKTVPCDDTKKEQKWTWTFTNTKLIEESYPPFRVHNAL